MSKWFDLIEAARNFVNGGSVSGLKAAVRAFDESRIEIVRDSMATATTMETLDYVKTQMPLSMTMSSRPFCHRDGRTDLSIAVSGFGPYFNGQHREDSGGNEFLFLSSSEEPGTWICYHLEEARIAVYGPGFRVVDVAMYLSPLHDSHARFGPAVYEAWARIES